MGVSMKGGGSVPAPTKAAGASWLMKGAAASQELEKKAKAEQAARQAAQGKMWGFWMKEGEENVQLTFVDGDLDGDGFFAPPRYYEHTIKRGSSYDSYVCPEKTNPSLGEICPICEANNKGENAYLVALFTVIDHRTFTSKDGDKSYTNSPKILKAKMKSAEYLAGLAKKRGGLAGIKFDITRVGDKSASIGSHYDFVDKQDAEVLRKQFTRKFKNEAGKEVVETVFKPADYDNEIVFLTEQELRNLGFGKGAVTGQNKHAQQATSDDYSDQL